MVPAGSLRRYAGFSLSLLRASTTLCGSVSSPLFRRMISLAASSSDFGKSFVKLSTTRCRRPSSSARSHQRPSRFTLRRVGYQDARILRAPTILADGTLAEEAMKV